MKKRFVFTLATAFLVALTLATPICGKANKLTKRGGVFYHDGIKETYYNLNMKRVVKRAKDAGVVEGEYNVREDGVKCIGKYVIVAAPYDTWDYGTCVMTSLGIGVVLDTGAFSETNKNQIDIAVDW